jgi:hypothetical protein
MIKKLFFTAIVLGFVAFGCNDEAKSDKDCEDKQDSTAVDKTATVDLETLYANPGEYVDKEVYVKATVDHVCKHGGKKLFVVQDDKSIRIHGTERFDEELIGKEVMVKAVFKEERIDSEYLAEWEAEVRETHKDDNAESIGTLEKIEAMKDSIADTENGYVSNYFMEFVDFKSKDCAGEHDKKDSDCDGEHEKKDSDCDGEEKDTAKEKTPVQGGC